MAYRKYSAVRAVLTATEIRLILNRINSALLAVGMTRTTDTGQTDINTMVLDNSTGTTHNLFYQFNDSLSATHPIIFRLSFVAMTNNTALGRPYYNVRVTVGEATNGAGVFNGSTIEINTNIDTTNSHTPMSTGVTYSLFTAGEGYLAASIEGDTFAQGLTTVNQSTFPLGCFIIFRSVDSTGVPTTESVSIASPAPLPPGNTVAKSGQPQLSTRLYSGGLLKTIGTTGAMGIIPHAPNAAVSPIVDGKIPIYPMYYFSNVQCVMNQMVLVNFDNVQRWDEFTDIVLGTTPKKYIVPDRGWLPMDMYGGNVSKATVALLCEGLEV